MSPLDEVVAMARVRAAGRIPVVGVAGPQGSGKTTLLRKAASASPRIVAFSIDDVYLGAASRKRLAAELHPLFVTRGVPGTHDLALYHATLDALQDAKSSSRTLIPAFDKVADDQLPSARWPVFEGRPEMILFDGWCVGATPQHASALAAPVNRLEADEDQAGVWRGYVNDQLHSAYASAFARLDAIFYLRAPGFEVVHAWRCQQEEELLGRPLTEADRTRIGRFIAHYERITRHMLDGGRRADIEVQLDSHRAVTAIRRAG